MGTSEFLIVLCSPRSATSEWVNREVAWFKTHRDPGKILALIVDGEPMASRTPGREGEECFPKTLLYKTGADLLPTEEFEDAPLAADARETGDGRRGAKLKLAAAMLGVGLDTLVNRDNRRRAERRRLVYAGLGSLSLVLGGLSIFAFNQRDAAVAAQLKSEAAEKDAKFQAEEAQSLVEFMLTDFRQELDSLGRLDVLERTGKRLLESFAKQDVAKLDANALGRRARVLLLLGEVDNTRGNLDAALARYKEASATTEELLKRNPGSAQQIFDHAQSVFWVGYIAWQRGDAVLAKKQFTEYYDLAQRLVAIDPDKDEWQMEVGYAVNNLGILALEQGKAMEAETAFRHYLEITTQLAAKQPSNMPRLIGVGQAYSWLADAQHRQGRLNAAAKTRIEELALYRSWLVSHSEDSIVENRATITKYGLAQNLLAQNKIEDALPLATDAMQSAERLFQLEPLSTDNAEQLAFAHAILGEVFLHLGRKDEARRSLMAAVTTAELLIEKDGGVALWAGRLLAQPKLILARLETIEGHHSRAFELYGEILNSLRTTIDVTHTDQIIKRRYCAALAGQARLSPDFSEAWSEAISILSRERERLGPEALALLAESYIRTANLADARSVVARLKGTDYRHPDFLALLDEFPELKAATVASAK